MKTLFLLCIPLILISCFSTPTVKMPSDLLIKGCLTSEESYKLLALQLEVLSNSDGSIKLKDLTNKDKLIQLLKIGSDKQNLEDSSDVRNRIEEKEEKWFRKKK